MNINETLSLIKDKCEDFSNLPESMRDNINKKEMRNYLINILKIEEKVTNNFLDLIYDDNEEDKDNVTTQHFIEKYTSLLKILETTESEDEEKNIINNNEEKGKELKEIDIGSLIKENNKGENLFDEEITKDLIKELNFNEYNNNNYFENPNFYSIIRPSNDFNLNLNNNLKIEEDLIKKESNIKKNNNQEEPKILNSNNLNSLKYDLRKMINNNNNNILYNMLNNQRHLSIKQKLQDVFFQIHKPNDIKRYNVYPDISKKFNFTYNPNKIYKTYISSPIKNDNYLKLFQSKFNKNYSPEKNNFDKLYSSNFKKYNINKKLEGLNKILFAEKLDDINQNDNILNPDDFFSLEEKIKQFEKKKIEIKRKHNQILNDINSGSIIFNERENE
jgi:hypothetical protein